MFAVVCLLSFPLRLSSEAEKKPVEAVPCFVCRDMTSHDHTLADKAEHKGKTYYFCNRAEAARFAASPEEYVFAEDPICGRRVDKAEGKYSYDQRVKYRPQTGAGLTENTKRFFFCSAAHRDRFASDPRKYLPPEFKLP